MPGGRFRMSGYTEKDIKDMHGQFSERCPRGLVRFLRLDSGDGSRQPCLPPLLDAVAVLLGDESAPQAQACAPA